VGFCACPRQEKDINSSINSNFLAGIMRLGLNEFCTGSVEQEVR
jgi:hypothetical protein